MKKTPKSLEFPPQHLSERALGLWNRLGATVGIAEGPRVMFIEALECLDRREEARQLIAAEGLTIVTKTGMSHIHPAVRVEAEARRQFCRIWGALGLARKPNGLESLFEEQEKTNGE